MSLKVEQKSTGGSSQLAGTAHGLTPNQADRPGSASITYKNTQEQTTTQSEGIQITLRNYGSGPDTVLIEWYFMAGLVNPPPGTPASAREYIFDKGAKSIVLNAGATEDFPATSTTVSSVIARSSQGILGGGRNLRHITARAPREEGAATRGWLVRVVADGKIVAAAGSKQSYEDLARDVTKLPVLPQP